MDLANPIERPPDRGTELVWVTGMLTAEPTWHVVRDLHAGRLATKCGEQVTWTLKRTLLPMRHARKFATVCPACRAAMHVPEPNETRGETS